MKRKKVITMITAALAFTMTVCGSSTAIAASELTAESKPATQYTIDANQEVYALLDFEDTTEFENATKGLLASPDTLDICDENGKVVWSQTAYAFLDQDAPDTANPSLWRDTQLPKLAHFSGNIFLLKCLSGFSLQQLEANSPH